MTRNWRVHSLVALSLAVACATATKEDLAGGDDDEKGGASGSAGAGTGGSSGFGGTFPTGGSFPKGGTAGTGGVATGGSAGKGGTAGKGGAATGGSDMGGMGDGGEGPVCSTHDTPPELRLDYKADPKLVTEDPAGIFHLVNKSSQAIPLSDLTFRYWFTSEFTCAQTTSQWRTNVVHFQLDTPYAQKNIPDVTTRVVSLDTGAPGCDAYFEIGFAPAAGSLAGGQMAIVNYYALMGIYDKPHDQSNDYSYGASTTAFVNWEKVTVYWRGCLASGTPPGGGGGEGGAGGEGGMSGAGGGGGI
jgi:hypothetical protein